MIDTKKVRPGEVLVLIVPEGTPSWQAQDLLRSVRTRLDDVPGVRVLVIGGGITAEVLTPERGDAVPAHLTMPGVEWHPAVCGVLGI